MRNSLLISGTAAVILFGASGAQALTITPNTDANELASALAAAGSGLTITGATFSGGNTAAGTFSGGAGSGIGIGSGVILSTGNVQDAAGPNSSDSTTTDFPPGGPDGDRTVLTLDFTTNTGELFFNYVFASEEYNEFVGSGFNDSFQLLLNGTSNIALIPGTTTPVSVNTVNLSTNAAFFNNNDPDSTTTPFDIEYDGFTDVFTASATGLDIGTLHSLSFIIADVGDGAYDAAVFIQGGSFGGTLPPPPTNVIPVPAALPLMLTGFIGFGLLGYRRRHQT